MGLLSVRVRSSYDGQIAGVLEPFLRRIEAMPPGTCPVAVHLSLLETSGAQTCGKCVPCRDGIPQLAEMMRSVLNCEAKEKVALRRAAIESTARVSGKTNPGETWMPFHFQDGNSNWLTNAALDNIAKAPEFKVCAVKVSKL